MISALYCPGDLPHCPLHCSHTDAFQSLSKAKKMTTEEDLTVSPQIEDEDDLDARDQSDEDDDEEEDDDE